jgi:F-type H+-transporting ATPase subunit gamma
MATLKELRLRIKSLKNTRKITAAMKMVSAAKLKRAKDASLQSKPYINKLNGIIDRVTKSVTNIENPLIQEREGDKTLYILFTSDRGLCGGFNNNLLKFFFKNFSVKEGDQVSIVGKKAYEVVKKSGIEVENYYESASSDPSIVNANGICRDLTSSFLTKKVDKVVLVFNQFVSTINQVPTSFQLLPFSKEDVESSSTVENSDSEDVEYIFEPNTKKLLDELLPKQISIQVYQSLLDNSAGEHAARMTAMENATQNANELTNTLTIQMNRARQAAITTELTEIVSGAESLKG